jgi:hypothetical protein
VGPFSGALLQAQDGVRYLNGLDLHAHTKSDISEPRTGAGTETSRDR